MINQSLLRRIQKKHPNRSLEEIEMVIQGHLTQLNIKLSGCQTIDLTIVKLGRIHTHGNSKNKSRAKTMKRIIDFKQNKIEYSDKQLLF